MLYLSIAKSTNGINVNPITLQVQAWIGNSLSPTDWGWKEVDHKYVPVMLSEGTRIAPDSILDMVNCNCTTGCTSARCSCVRFSFPCNLTCGNCQGESCNNLT